MAGDFGGHDLPVNPGEFFPAHRGALFQLAKWDWITSAMKIVLSDCVLGKGQPGWTVAVGGIVVFVVPTDSTFRRQWLPWSGEVGTANSSNSMSTP